MQAMTIGSPATLETLAFAERPDPGEPGRGEIRVALHGSTLNNHDSGSSPAGCRREAGRVPLADGAGVVEAVGAGVTEFAVGDAVVSCFFPDWQDGPATIGNFARTPGDGIDGYATAHAVAPATAFTRAPRGYDAVEAAAITTAGLTAWRALVGDGGLKAGDTVLLLGTGGVSIWGAADRQGDGGGGGRDLVVRREAGARARPRRRPSGQLPRGHGLGPCRRRLDRRARGRSRAGAGRSRDACPTRSRRCGSAAISR